MIRIKDGDYDWKSASETDVIDELIKHLKLNTPTSYLETAIEELAWAFSCVQKAYHDWAKQFKNHEDAISGLSENGIDGRRCQKQHSFTLHSSNWNPITLSILYALVPDCMARMKDKFNKIGRTTADPYIRACGTTAFKHLHLHPTTSALGKPKGDKNKIGRILHYQSDKGH